MQTKTRLAIFLVLTVALAVTACGTSPTPTRPVPTAPPQVITVVITATLPPPTATSAAPTITPIPTLPITPTGSIATPVAKAATATTARPAGPTATRRPPTTAPLAPSATPVPVALKYPAPRLIGPIFDEGIGKRDERHHPGDALVFEWQSIGALGEHECYLVRVDFKPGQGDAFLQCNAAQATQLGAGQTARFTLNQPRREGPNYSGLLSTQASDMWVQWSVTVVRDDGVGTGAIDASGTRHKTVPLSPSSAVVQFILKGS